MLSGCQGKPRTPTIIEKICPNCGSIIELFSIDTQMACETCGFIAYNDTLSCVQWCQYARKCVGDEMYDHMMAIAASQKERAAAVCSEKRFCSITADGSPKETRPLLLSYDGEISTEGVFRHGIPPAQETPQHFNFISNGDFMSIQKVDYITFRNTIQI